MVRTAAAAIAIFLAAVAPSAAQTPARESLTVFAAGAVKAAMSEIFERYEADGAAHIVPHYDTVGTLRDRALAAGDADSKIVP